MERSDGWKFIKVKVCYHFKCFIQIKKPLGARKSAYASPMDWGANSIRDVILHSLTFPPLQLAKYSGKYRPTTLLKLDPQRNFHNSSILLFCYRNRKLWLIFEFVQIEDVMWWGFRIGCFLFINLFCEVCFI